MTSSNELEMLKNKGNAAFASGNFQEAIHFFNEAISMDSSNHIFYSNRSAAYASLKDWAKALEDAEKSIKIKPDWAKGYGRKASALFGMGLFEEAEEAYQKGLELEPENQQLQKGLEAVNQKLASFSSQKAQNPFSSPDIWAKLASNPKTSPMLAQQDFVRMVQDLQTDPNAMNKYMNDPRFFALFGAVLGVDISQAAAATPTTETDASHTEDTDIPMREKEKEKEKESLESEKVESKPSQPIINEKLDPKQKKILDEKNLGNEAYKKKDFETALKHYDLGLEMDPENISILLNKSAVYFESDRLEECIETCNKVIDLGREQHTDFKILAKAFARIGSSHQKKEDFDNAIKFYNKSLAECRNAEVLDKLKAVEKLKKQREREAYYSPELSEQSRNKGNEFFKKELFVEAVSCYTEAIKRDDADPRNYTNRAACYLKLAAIPEGLKDAEKAIELDPSFVKGYIRKAALLFAKKDYANSLEACELAMSHDKDGKNYQEISIQIQKCYQEINKQSSNQTDEEKLKKAMENPEVREIMSDPVMNQILKQMQSNPQAIQEHLRNPVVANKIRKLIAAGIIQTR